MLSIGALLNPRYNDGNIISFGLSPDGSKSSRIPRAHENASDSLSSDQFHFLNQQRVRSNTSCSVFPYLVRSDTALPAYHHHTLPTLSPSILPLNSERPLEENSIGDQYYSPNRGSKGLDSNSKYAEEHMYFLWYHYVDLHRDWEEILAIFHRQFPGIRRLNVEVIRQKLRRFVKKKGAPSPRMQRSIQEVEHTEKPLNPTDSSLESDSRNSGVLQLENVWYSWMEKNTFLTLGQCETQS
jgi:hypothetical protein